MKGDERRAAIVAAAIRVFAEKGFRGTTTRELAGAAGVTEPVLYQHFRTKRDLYTAIIEKKAHESSGQLAEFVKLAPGGDDERLFTAIAGGILERYAMDPDLSRLLMFSSLERHELSELFFERVLLEFHNLLRGFIRRRIATGAYRKVDPTVAARSFVGMVSHHGLVSMLHPARPRKPHRTIVRQTVAIFLNGIKSPIGNTSR